MKLPPHLPLKYGFDGGKSPPSNVEGAGDNGHFVASFDNRLWMFYRCWEPSSSDSVRATLMIVHGTVDHGGVYEELAQTLVKSGIAVIAMDMRGWGLSDGESMYIDDIDTFVNDVHHLYKHVHQQDRFQNVKARFLLGKSVGGTITAHCVSKYPDCWTGLVGLSGAYQIDPNLQPNIVLGSLLRHVGSRVLPKYPLKPLFDEHLIVRDEQALQNWRDDKLCSKDKVRVGYFINLLEGAETIPGILDKIPPEFPRLMMIGDADKVVTLSGHEIMIQNATEKTLKTYPGGYHNLLQEPSLQAQVIEDIKEWLCAKGGF